MSAPTVLEAAFAARGDWAAALLSDNAVYVLLLNPREPGREPAWRQLPTIPSGTPVSVGLVDGGASVLLVMQDGHAYRLSNEPTGASTMAWIELPALPGTDAAGG